MLTPCKHSFREVKEVARDGRAGQQKNQVYNAVFDNEGLFLSATPELVWLLTAV